MDILYSVTSAGVWIARTNTSGQLTEANSSNLLAWNRYGNSKPTIGTPSSTPGAEQHHKYAILQATLAGGASANFPLLAALAGYFGVVKIIGILSNTTIAALTLTWECPAGTAALPGTTVLSMTENIVNKALEGIIITGAGVDPNNDNDAIVVDISGGAGAEVITFILETWYET